jgi:hypothetical protein
METTILAAYIGAMTTSNSLRSLPLAALFFTAALAACSRPDARLEKLTVGIPTDSVLKIMGVEKPKRLVPYLANGHFIEAMYYPKPGATDSAATTDRKMSPVVVVDGKLVGWGWTTWDSIAAANKIVVAPK